MNSVSDTITSIDTLAKYSNRPCDSSVSSTIDHQHRILETFEDNFKEKYKVSFEDFINVVMNDYPELRI